MKSGQIIRRALHTGCPVGPWLQIMGFSGKFVSVRVIETGETTLLLRENIYEPTCVSLYISPAILTRVLNGNQTAIEHPLLGKWETAQRVNLDILRLYDRTGRTVYYTVEHVYKFANLVFGGIYVRIVLDHKIIQL